MWRRLAGAGLLAAGLALLWGAPLRAELSANDYNAQLLKSRDEARAPLTKWQAVVTAKTEDHFDEVKGKLAETWKEGRADAVKAVKAKLAERRQAITDLLAGDPERLDRVAKKLKEVFDGRIEALEEAGATVDADAAAFAATGRVTQEAALEKLEELTAAALAPVSDAEWGTVFEAANGAFAELTAAEQTQQAKAKADEMVAEAAKSVQSWINAVERDFSRIVHCDYEDTTNSLVCDKALAVSAAEISAIDVRGLPSTKTVTVTASTARDGVITSGTDPELQTLTLEAPHADQVQVAIYLPRRMRPAYRRELAAFEASNGPAQGSEAERAARALRQSRYEVYTDDGMLKGAPKGGGSDLALVVSGKAPSVRVTVQVGDGEDAKVVTAALELGYARWGVDTGGFFALSPLADEELVTGPGTDPDTVSIARIDGGDDWTQDTGVFLNLVPKNYPYLGIGVGFSANEDQPNTFYLGGSLRLLSFRNRGVASFSIGATARSVKRFPGLHEGMDNLAADDPRLEGKSEIHFAPYAVLQLGFSFGRIPGAGDSE